jgi:hypothetical protein
MNSTAPRLQVETLNVLPIGSLIGVYETERSRKFLNLFVKVEGEAAHEWELWFSNTHCVGYFHASDIERMLAHWQNENKDIRVNHRITR